MEERVIDRYVIDTHPPLDTPSENTPLDEETAAHVEDFPVETPVEEVQEVSEIVDVSQVSEVSEIVQEPEVKEHIAPEDVEQFEEEKYEVEEPVVVAQKVEAAREAPHQTIEDEPEFLISSSWSAAAADNAAEPLSGDEEAIEREFTAALQHGEEASDVLSVEVTRSFEQETGNFPYLREFTLSSLNSLPSTNHGKSFLFPNPTISTLPFSMEMSSERQSADVFIQNTTTQPL